MSCFVVENNTLNKIATAVFVTGPWGETREDLASLGIKTPKQLVDAMYKLNLAAYDYRYPEDKDIEPAPYSYKKLAGTDTEVYKAVRCWSYQCTEGDIDQDPLYVVMNEYRALLADHIVRNLPEYDAAPWN